MPERFSGRLWHALKRYLGPEVVSLIAQALAGPGIRLHWDFLTDTPLRQVWPELAARGVQRTNGPSMSTTMGLSSTLGISVLVTMIAAVAVILRYFVGFGRRNFRAWAAPSQPPPPLAAQASAGWLALPLPSPSTGPADPHLH